MSETFGWCKDKTRLAIWDKQVFCVDECGGKYWIFNGKSHRINGPAIEYADGNKYWYLNDQLHRENGPAVEYANGGKHWYLNGESYSESDYWGRSEERRVGKECRL